jgi:aspartyl-tRNA(Asn)/glutamyl-tRNA(Gln) amidotransferase subunit A
VVTNFQAQPEVKRAFKQIVEKIRRLYYPMKSVAVPSWNPRMGLDNIERDRKAIAVQAFKDVDLLLLPTTTTTVPTMEDARGNAQALSGENTIFANYFGLPAISAPCGFDHNRLPLGLQLVGKPWDEASVLQLGHQFERSQVSHR